MMNRTTWLQDRRMQKFRDVWSRWEHRELSAEEAGELLGCSERQFRRYRARYEEEGLEGLIDKNKLRTVLSPTRAKCSYLLRRTAKGHIDFLEDIRSKIELKK